MAELERIVLRSWRVSKADPSGCTVWFDPSREQLQLYALDPPKDEGVADALEGDDQLGLGLPIPSNEPPGSSDPGDLPF